MIKLTRTDPLLDHEYSSSPHAEDRVRVKSIAESQCLPNNCSPQVQNSIPSFGQGLSYGHLQSDWRFNSRH